MSRFPFLTFGTSFFAIVASLLPGWPGTLEFRRDAISNGELWRLFTAHVTHYTPSHLVWDLALFLVLGVWVERQSRKAWMMTLGVSALAISLCAWFCAPAMWAYRGLSGVDSALFAWLAVDLIRMGWRARRWSTVGIGSGAIGFMLAKVAYECATGILLFVDPAGVFVPVPWAHGLGALCGVGIALLFGSRVNQASAGRRAEVLRDRTPHGVAAKV